ncbi:MAG: hypothetical protein ACLRM8_00610 [Alistipes sp.]
MAYRFVARQPGEVLVAGEEARFRFAREPSHSCPMCATPLQARRTGFRRAVHASFENTYTRTPLCEMDSARLAFLPLLVQTAGV